MFKTVADLKRDGRIVEDFDREAAPIIDWRRAKIGFYYYFCPGNYYRYHHHSIRLDFICRVKRKGGKGAHRWMILKVINRYGVIEELEIPSDDEHQNIYVTPISACCLWPMTAKEVAAFKRQARQKSAEAIRNF